jgi:hypothetical protein
MNLEEEYDEEVAALYRKLAFLRGLDADTLDLSVLPGRAAPVPGPVQLGPGTYACDIQIWRMECQQVTTG